ncbi:thiamine pyrophosphate-dependent enzyme [Sedimentibacter sp. B4]|uniref:thiamine pyrophosphate-dependent enzyme n=1 Tax=Sedimentibacter sp. B4 TaxID=304766 RepID=UPI0002E13720|nr:thiamine pyrophosphate-dependent enzyme [Sedimentibacter sp. B4]
MEKIYSRPESINKGISGYCPGCMHSTITKIVAQAIDELQLREKTVCILPVGCSTLGAVYWNLDMIAASHGRAPAVATGVKRCKPESVVFTYQGDGDLASIGMSEIMHAANRGEKITTIFVNNSIYGMTGGQMAPTTLVGQKSTTSPLGRNPETEGYPIKMCELISQLQSPVYVARFAVDTPAHINQAKAGIKKAFLNQLNNKGFSFIEILSNCPTNWGMSPLDTLEYIKEKTMKEFPLGVFRDKED